MARRAGTVRDKTAFFSVIGASLREIREERKITQMALAKKMNLTTAQYISNVERGISPPSVEYLQTIKKVCKVPATTLVYLMSEATKDYYAKQLG